MDHSWFQWNFIKGFTYGVALTPTNGGAVVNNKFHCGYTGYNKTNLWLGPQGTNITDTNVLVNRDGGWVNFNKFYDGDFTHGYDTNQLHHRGDMIAIAITTPYGSDGTKGRAPNGNVFYAPNIQSQNATNLMFISGLGNAALWAYQEAADYTTMGNGFYFETNAVDNLVMLGMWMQYAKPYNKGTNNGFVNQYNSMFQGTTRTEGYGSGYSSHQVAAAGSYNWGDYRRAAMYSRANGVVTFIDTSGETNVFRLTFGHVGNTYMTNATTNFPAIGAWSNTNGVNDGIPLIEALAEDGIGPADFRSRSRIYAGTIYATNFPGIQPGSDPLTNIVARLTALTNLIYTVGGNGTNHADAIAVACSNLSYTIGAALTNYTKSEGALSTNFTLATGLLLTNFSKAEGALSTNFTKAEGALSTNFTVARAGELTNYVKAEGALSTNYTLGAFGANSNLSYTLSAGNTNHAANVLQSSTNYTDAATNRAVEAVGYVRLTNNVAFVAGSHLANPEGTNITLQARKGVVYVGTSNVNFVALMGGVLGEPVWPTIIITNGTGANWGISFSAVSNAWHWPYVTAPTVLTNGTKLMLSTFVDGTNIDVAPLYFPWP